MVTIPAWMLAVEASILYVILLSVYLKYKHVYILVSWIALVLSFPVIAYIFSYTILDYLSLEDSRMLIRYVQALMIFTNITLFVVVLRLPNRKN